MLYSEQLRAARALLRWEQAALAARAGVSVVTIKRLERLDGPIMAVKVSTVEAIRRVLEDAGIELIAPEEGVRGPGAALRWRVSSRQTENILGEGEGNGGVSNVPGESEAMAAYWLNHPQEWAELSQVSRDVLGMEMYGFPDGRGEPSGV
jgi:transcriptional regulator with XRE-family HTH domain